MNTATKFTLACLASFLVGSLMTGAVTYYLSKGALEFAVLSEMAEDFTTSIAVITYFETNNSNAALNLARENLEASCKAYVLPLYSEDVRQRAKEFVAEAKALGYCQ